MELQKCWIINITAFSPLNENDSPGCHYPNKVWKEKKKNLNI